MFSSHISNVMPLVIIAWSQILVLWRFASSRPLPWADGVSWRPSFLRPRPPYMGQVSPWITQDSAVTSVSNFLYHTPVFPGWIGSFLRLDYYDSGPPSGERRPVGVSQRAGNRRPSR